MASRRPHPTGRAQRPRRTRRDSVGNRYRSGRPVPAVNPGVNGGPQVRGDRRVGVLDLVEGAPDSLAHGDAGALRVVGEGAAVAFRAGRGRQFPQYPVEFGTGLRGAVGVARGFQVLNLPTKLRQPAPVPLDGGPVGERLGGARRGRGRPGTRVARSRRGGASRGCQPPPPPPTPPGSVPSPPASTRAAASLPSGAETALGRRWNGTDVPTPRRVRWRTVPLPAAGTVTAMRVRLLGSVDVVLAGTPTPVAGLRRKAVLAAPGLAAGPPGRTPRVVGIGWGGAPPAPPPDTLPSHHPPPPRPPRGPHALLAP